MPAYLLLLPFTLVEYCDFHATIKRGEVFTHVYYLKTDVLEEFGAFCSEIEPLVVTECVCVVLCEEGVGLWGVWV